jgi:hypothetical protein
MSTKKLRIVSDGTAIGTHVFDADGKPITAPISRITWDVLPGGIAVARVEFFAEVDVVGEVRDG